MKTMDAEQTQRGKKQQKNRIERAIIMAAGTGTRMRPVTFDTPKPLIRVNGVRMIDTQGTYLIWLDFRQTGLTVEELDHKIIYEAGLWLDSGKIFGKTGEGFERINVACPRAVLQEALDRIQGILQ